MRNRVRPGGPPEAEPLAPPDDEGSGRREPRGLATAWHVAATTTLTSTPVFLPGAASPLIDRDLGWSAGGLGAVLSVFWLGSLIGAWLSRRIRVPLAAERVLAAAMLVTAVALAAVAVLPAAGLWAGGALGGGAYGFSQPYGNQALLRRCAPGVRGRAFGLKQAAVPAATLLCSVVMPVAAVPLGWRAVFGGGAVVCLGYAAVLALRGPGEPWRGPVSGGLGWDRRLAALAGVGLLGAAIGNSLGAFLILTLVGDGFDLTGAGLLAAAAAALSVLVRIGAGWVTDRSQGRGWRDLTAMFAIGAVGTALLAAGSRPLGAAGAFLGYAGGWGWAGLLHYLAGAAYPGRERAATALTQMGVSLGAAVGPFGFGQLYELGAGRAWWLMAAAAVAGTAGAVTAARIRSA
ncbi:MFS transporter [Kitasatospora sp. NPDC089509]|uniref:MFS transporter n=1 Tax=Kitasatospora sp. NPDC089509 TaxID=3364079 RepID=UPI00380C3219